MLSTPPAVDKIVARTRLELLREETRDAHRRVESALPVLDPCLTHARYTRVIEALHGFHAPLEPGVRRALGIHAVALDLAARAKVQLLVADLTSLGRTSMQIAALPRCAHLPSLHSPSAAIGVLYVVEGSTLGGRIIRRRLAEALGIDAASGAAFFTGYEEATGAMWGRFVEYVSSSSLIDTAAAVRAAIDTFETLAQWLDHSLAGA